MYVIIIFLLFGRCLASSGRLSSNQNSIYNNRNYALQKSGNLGSQQLLYGSNKIPVIFSGAYLNSYNLQGSQKTKSHHSFHGSQKTQPQYSFHGSQKTQPQYSFHGSQKTQPHHSFHGSQKIQTHHSFHGSQKTKSNIYQGSQRSSLNGHKKTYNHVFHGSQRVHGSQKIHSHHSFHGSSKINTHSYHKPYNHVFHGSQKTQTHHSFHGSQKIHTYHSFQGSQKTQSYSKINAFSPTRQPTEGLPPTTKAPPPTFYPTQSFIIPDIPLSFNIKQGFYGYVSNANDALSVLTKVSAQTAEIDVTEIRNAQLFSETAAQRKLSASFLFDYNIATIANNESPDVTYKKIVSRLKTSISNNNFTNSIKKMNITLVANDIVASPYSVVSAKNQTISSSLSQNSDNNTTKTIVFVIIGLSVVILMSAYEFNRRKAYEFNRRKAYEYNRKKEGEFRTHSVTISPLSNSVKN